MEAMPRRQSLVLLTTFCLLYLVLNITPVPVRSLQVRASSLEFEGRVEPETSEACVRGSLALQTGPSPPDPPSLGTIAIIVEDTLYPAVSVAVTQYRQDLNNSGYNTILYTQPIDTHQELKGNLTHWHESEDLLGAVLIGRLPYAQFYHPAGDFDAETFICDLYLMDLDGTWSDTNPKDGIYDDHYPFMAGSDIYPEIFVGRIDPSCLSWGSGTASHVNTYLSRIHSYRTGGVQRQGRALVYVDDDWSGYWGSRWDNDVGLAYSNRTFEQTDELTRASDWLNRLSQDYQMGHVCVHSSPIAHYFGPGGSGEGIATNTQIRGVPPAFNFYNLFACSGTKWTVADNLGVTYAFSGNYSLASVGSTKTGSMMDCNYFYEPLGLNMTIGNSLAQWFSNSLTTSSSAGSLYLEWYYGMDIIGDPLLTLQYDCTVLAPIVSSSTHPISNQWYTNPRPQLNWTVPPDVNAISGYFYVIDRNASTVPAATTGTYTAMNGTQVSVDLDDGTWYLHVVATDSVGNTGTTAAHYRINIDQTAPSVAIETPSDFHNSSADSLDLAWSAIDTCSGCVKSKVWVDNSSAVIYDGSALSIELTALSEGSHTINVTVFDAAGNLASAEIEVQVDLTNPIVSITNPLEGALTWSDFVVTWLASDEGSGYQKAEIWVDDTLQLTVQSPDTTGTISALAAGAHSVIVVVFDWANRSASANVTITVFPTSLAIGLIVGLVVVVIAIPILRKR